MASFLMQRFDVIHFLYIFNNNKVLNILTNKCVRIEFVKTAKYRALYHIKYILTLQIRENNYSRAYSHGICENFFYFNN